VRLEGLGEMKNPMTSSGIEPANFRLAAQCLTTKYATAVSRDFTQVLSENVAVVGKTFRDYSRIFLAYSKCAEATSIKILWFLSSPYSLIGMCKSVQNCTFRDCTGTFYSLL
jgi:hypothetical protein